MNDYPMLRFIVRWGALIAGVLALAVAGLGIFAAVSGASYLWALVGLGGAAVGYGLMLSYVELVKLIVDMLVPK